MEYAVDALEQLYTHICILSFKHKYSQVLDLTLHVQHLRDDRCNVRRAKQEGQNQSNIFFELLSLG